MSQCEGQIREGPSAKNFMRFGRPPEMEWHQCVKEAVIEVEVKSREKKECGTMLLCDTCFVEFKNWATLPWTYRNLRTGVVRKGRVR
jgi:hypothetical protein